MQISSLVESAVSPNFAARQKSNYILAKKQPCCLENSVTICKCWHTLNYAFLHCWSTDTTQVDSPKTGRILWQPNATHGWTQPLANS